MPNHVWNRTYDLWDAGTILLADCVSQLPEHWASKGRWFDSHHGQAYFPAIQVWT